MPENAKLSAAQRSRIRRRSLPAELDPAEEGGELNIVLFLDIITNVLMFVLATITVTFTTMTDSQPPKSGGPSSRPPTKPTLSLNIIVVDKGFIVSAFGTRIGEGCQGPGSGVAVGLKSADGRQDYDYGSPPQMGKRPKKQGPEAADETAAPPTANKDVPYQGVMGTIDAIRRADDGQELFPDINFGVPK